MKESKDLRKTDCYIVAGLALILIVLFYFTNFPFTLVCLVLLLAVGRWNYDNDKLEKQLEEMNVDKKAFSRSYRNKAVSVIATLTVLIVITSIILHYIFSADSPNAILISCMLWFTLFFISTMNKENDRLEKMLKKPEDSEVVTFGK